MLPPMLTKPLCTTGKFIYTIWRKCPKIIIEHKHNFNSLSVATNNRTWSPTNGTHLEPISLGNNNERSYRCMKQHFCHICCPIEIKQLCNVNFAPTTSRRNKSKRKGRSGHQDDYDSDSSSDDDDDADFEEETDAPKNYKQMTIHLSSMRTDAVISSGLNMARKKRSCARTGVGIEHTNLCMLHTNLCGLHTHLCTRIVIENKLGDGDYVDLVTEVNENKLKVKRVKILKIKSAKTSTGRFTVVVRAWRGAFEIERENKWKAEER